MLLSTRVEFADNSKVKTITIASKENNPAIMDLSIEAKDTTEPSRNISITENEAGAIVDAIREHLKGILKEKGVKA